MQHKLGQFGGNGMFAVVDAPAPKVHSRVSVHVTNVKVPCA